MTKANLKMVEKPLQPVKPAEFQTAIHRYQQFDCYVPKGLSRQDLENPALWVNVAARMKPFDEVRAIADDHSFAAYLIVTFVQGTDAKLKLIHGVELENTEDAQTLQGKYDVQLRGAKKWVVYNTDTGEIIKQDIPKRVQAYKELDDYVAALNR